MSEITIDEQQALDLMQRAVNVKGADYVYETFGDSADHACVYVDTTVRRDEAPAPSCLVGHALVYAGVDPVLLWEADTEQATFEDEEYGDTHTVGDTGINSSEFRTYLKQHGVNLTERAVTVFAVAQTNQDMGISWGEALSKAEARLLSDVI